MPGDPLRVVNGFVELVAHVDDAAGATESKHDEGEGDGQHHRVVPGKRLDPTKQARASTQPAGNLDRRNDGEHRQQGRYRHHGRHGGVNELEAGADLRVREEVVDADGHREHQEQHERYPSHGVAVQAPADGARHDGVEDDVRRHQPEIDDGVQRPGEQDASKTGVDGVGQAQRCRKDKDQDFDGRADRRPRPEVGACNVAEHRQRDRRAGVFLLPGVQVDRHERYPYP